MARTIESPGVQITEIDLSTRPDVPTGTSVLVAGFAAQGPSDEVVEVTSLSEFTNIYGQPQTPAERYFYHSAAPLFNTAGRVYTYKLPYGAGAGTGFGLNYGALVYPVRPVTIDYSNPATYGNTLSRFSTLSANVLYLVGKPTHFELTSDQYNSILQGSFQWSDVPGTSFNTIADFGKAGMIVLNKGQTSVNDMFEGYYIGAVDNSNLTPASDFTAVLNVLSLSNSALATTNYLTVPSTRLNFALSSQSDNIPTTDTTGNRGSSVSQVLENASTFDLFGDTFNDSIIFGVFKLQQSVFSPTTIKLDYVFSEKYVGSFDYWRQINSQNGGQPENFFLPSKDDASPNVTILINDYISHKNGQTWLTTAGVPSNMVRLVTNNYATNAGASTLLRTLSTSYGIVNPATATAQANSLALALTGAYAGIGPADNLFTVGAYSNTDVKTKDLGSIPQKLDRLFDVAENTELYDIDLSIDGGVSTIFAVSQYIKSTPSLSATVNYFDDTVFVAPITGLYTTVPENITPEAATFKANYLTIINRYADFAGLARKDHLFIADLPRNIFVQGQNFLPLTNPNYNFSLNIYSPIRNVINPLNTSYSTTYANWAKVFDSTLQDFCWVPFSGFAAAAMVNTDTLYQPWFAPAGFVRGNVPGVTELAIVPKQKQRDQLYKISTNPVTFFPNEGFVIYGQKTLLKQPSAFDRINVRRLFLNLEKATANTVKFFVFEPNTLLTRTRVVNALTPIFENAKNTEGLFDYLIVCDERNNPPAVIDANELVVDIYLKPVRTAEFILVNFYATRTSTNFQELIS
jgi:hypothetical protein